MLSIFKTATKRVGRPNGNSPSIEILTGSSSIVKVLYHVMKLNILLACAVIQ